MHKDSISLVISAEAGQGLNTIEGLLPKLLIQSGYHVFLSKEFMSRVRGGNNTSEFRISSENVSSYVDKIDVLVVLSPGGIIRIENRLTPQSIIIGEPKNIDHKYSEMGCTVIAIDFNVELSAIGGDVFISTFIVGLISGFFKCNENIMDGLVKSLFVAKGEEIITKNIAAYERGVVISKLHELPIFVQKDQDIISNDVMSGTDTICMGAIAGGCSFLSAYPMSPSTGVLTGLAKQSKKTGIIVEQAEDEISAINMMLGAWYAGARGMVTTSGGGFALMTEGISLAGCIESPAVIHLAQRPGPATGLPTRTEQGDLNLALYAGHGDFPRVIYAPGTLIDGIVLTRMAFDVADQYQIPVIILTDQYFLDSIGEIDKTAIPDMEVNKYITETASNYNRYAITPSGISPRGIPGFGHGVVCVDSDEHTEDGRITEDFNVRIEMVNKRMRKLAGYSNIEPELIGNSSYEILVIGWGSTYGAICEALKIIKRDDIAFAYFKQVYPVPLTTHKLFSQAKLRIIIENNATGQFGNLLKMVTLLDIHKKILKYNGMPFSVEELVIQITEIIAT